MSETALSEVPAAVYILNGSDWKSIDGGASKLTIYGNDSNGTYRIIALSKNNEYVLNTWVKSGSLFNKLSERFYTFQSEIGDPKIYGLNIGDELAAMDFSCQVENVIQLLKINLKKTESSPPENTNSTTPELTTISLDSRDRSDSVSPAKMQARKSLAASQLRKKTLRITQHKVQLRMEEGRHVKVSLSKNISLVMTAKNFMEESYQLLRNTNKCVLDTNTPTSVMSMKKITEILQMVLILTQKSDLNSCIHKLREKFNEFVSSNRLAITDKGTVEQDTVNAAVGRAVYSVMASLIVKIHTELVGLQIMTTQMICILTYVANITLDHVAMIQLFSTIRAYIVAATKLFDAVATLKVIQLIKAQGGTPATTSRPDNNNASKEERRLSSKAFSFEATSDEGENIWQDPTADELESDDDVKLGSLNQLVVKLTSPIRYDSKFLNTFIATYRSFTNPWTLLEKLKQRFNVPNTTNRSKENIVAIQLRVAIVLKYWVENQVDDFDDELVLYLQQFIGYLCTQEASAKTAEALLKLLEDKIRDREMSTILWFQEPEPVEIPEEGLCLSDLFLVLPAQDIAEQLTLIDFDIFKNIKPNELLNQSWNKPKLKHRAPNVIAAIQRSTRVSFWVATMVLSQDDKQYRLKMMERFCEVCKCLMNLNNFNTLWGIMAGLHLASVHRLGASEKASKMDIWKKVEKLMKPEGNHNNYRKVLANVTGPCIPYLGVHLTDLVFIEDGNPDNLDEKINYKKRDLVVDTISMIQTFQQSPYRNIEITEPIYTFLQELPFLEDKELFEVSQFVEPKKKKLLGTSMSSDDVA